jgi:acyl carrier protein
LGRNERMHTNMENEKMLREIFIETFEIDENTPESKWVYNALPQWDSVGHMAMISAVEDKFDVMLETDDIIDWSSYEKGKEILSKYGKDF